MLLAALACAPLAAQATTVAEPPAARQAAVSSPQDAQPPILGGTHASQPVQASAQLAQVAPPDSGKVRVGLIVPLSGPNARIGRDMLDAAQLALFDAADERIVLLPRDDEGTSEGAAKAAVALLDAGVKLILGPLLSTTVESVAAPARNAGVPVLAFSTDRLVAGNGVYLLGFLPGSQVERVVAHAQVQGARRFAALAPKNPYGNQVIEDFRRAVQALGAQLGPVRQYEANDDIRQVVRQLANYDARKSALAAQRAELRAKKDEASLQALKRLETAETSGPPDFDSLLVAEGGDKLLSIAPLLPYYDIDPTQVRILGTGLWENSNVRSEPALAGAVFAVPPLAPRAAFEKRFRDAYGRESARLASIAYDGMALAAVLGKAAAPDFGASRLTQRNGFAGVDGVFRLLSTGLAERGLAILEVQRDGFRIVSPAPEAFNP